MVSACSVKISRQEATSVKAVLKVRRETLRPVVGEEKTRRGKVCGLVEIVWDGG